MRGTEWIITGAEKVRPRGGRREPLNIPRKPESQKGFTLIEIIAATAIMSIVMVTLGAVFMLCLTMVRSTNFNYASQSIQQIVTQRLQDELKYAGSVTITDTAARSPSVSFTQAKHKYLYVSVDGGNQGSVVSKNAAGSELPVVSAAGYTGVLYFSCNAASPHLLNVTLTVRSGTASSATKFSVYLMNASFSGPASGNAVDYCP